MPRTTTQIPERYEFKFLITEQIADAIRRALAPFCSVDEHSAAAPRRQYLIQSLYLDTRDRGLYRASRDERSGRFKARVRCYGETGPVFFEIKRKTGDFIRKSRVPIPRSEWVDRISGRASAGADGVEGDFVALVRRHRLAPSALVAYHREAYVGRFEDYARVTFDRGVRAQRSSHLSVDAQESAWTAVDDAYSTHGVRCGVILELKASLDVPRWMTALCREFDLWRLSFSKYCVGVERSLGFRSRFYLPLRTPTWPRGLA